MSHATYEADLWKAIALSARIYSQGVADDAFTLGRSILPGVSDQLTVSAVRDFQNRHLVTIFHFGLGPEGTLVTMLTPSGRKIAELVE